MKVNNNQLKCEDKPTYDFGSALAMDLVKTELRISLRIHGFFFALNKVSKLMISNFSYCKQDLIMLPSLLYLKSITII